jgi:hypothetical protein
MRAWVWIYVTAFAALTVTDIASTLWATGSGGQEFNAAVATEGGALHLERMIGINVAFLLFSTGMLVWALRQRDRIDPRYLERPERALFNYFYLNPFSQKIVPKSAFHYIALAPTVLGVKAFASLNNSLIGAAVPDVVTPIARAISSLGAGPMATFWIIIALIFHPFWWAALHLTARALRKAGASSAHALAQDR